MNLKYIWLVLCFLLFWPQVINVLASVGTFEASEPVSGCTQWGNNPSLFSLVSHFPVENFYLDNTSGNVHPALSIASHIDFVVDQEGHGDFKTIQEAINAVPVLRKNPTTIFIRKGTYKEKLLLPYTKTNVIMIGENVDSTIVTYDDFAARKNRFGEEIGTSGSSGFYVNGEGFVARNITFSNTAGPVGQAVAVRVDADKVIFENCIFSGYQDTLYLHGKNSRQYYRNCVIKGTTDFIFGWSTAVFEDCTIICREGGRYITAASTEQDSPYGMVFIRCKLIGDVPPRSVYLGRPWRSYARTVFINCFMGDHIRKKGWHNWSKPAAEKTAFYAEYRSTGPGASPMERVGWSHQLTEEAASQFTIRNVLGGPDHWDPRTVISGEE